MNLMVLMDKKDMDPVAYEHQYYRMIYGSKIREAILDYEEWTYATRKRVWYNSEHNEKWTRDIVFIKSVQLYDIKELQVELNDDKKDGAL